MSNDPWRFLRSQREPEVDDVHVDWHMTLAEWEELRRALLDAVVLTPPEFYPYIRKLMAQGKLDGRRSEDQAGAGMSDEYLKAVIEDAIREYPTQGAPAQLGWDPLDYEEEVPALAEHIAAALRLSKDPMREN